MTPLRIALCDDFREERWASMDRVAAMLHQELSSCFDGRYAVTRACPPFERLAGRVPLAGRLAAAFKTDRYLNRFWRYPRSVESRRGSFDLFHIVDHSYAHLAHVLPAERTVVTCHDLDAFRSLTIPADEPRSAAFRRTTRQIAAGLARAACVICDTDAVRRELVGARLVDASRTVVAPLGVDDRFFGEDDATGPSGSGLEILHVGSNVRRKRLDVLLRVCGAVAKEFPELRLVRVGDPLTAEQRRLAREAGIADRIAELNSVDEETLARRYRRAALVLQPSDREGFGLPVLEALASGTPVVATDLPVLREVGGSAVTFCASGDVDAWRESVAALLRERAACPARWRARREAGRAHARRFTWRRCADIVASVYERVAGSPQGIPGSPEGLHYPSPAPPSGSAAL